MATLVLQAAGTAVGGLVGGPFGAVLGRTIGAVAGSFLDNQIFGSSTKHISGPKLEQTQFLSSREGAPIPVVFGRSRIAGEIIWATNFEEVQQVETQSQGGKGSAPKTTTTTFSYFANFAIALCQGEVATIGRIWVDGKLIEQADYSIRLHKGTESQLPDSFIESKQGAGLAPAYRGVAYLVFENFPVEGFGNRIPQISVEVIRPIGDIEKRIKAVNVIPGATEFGYDTQPVIEAKNDVEYDKLNVHQTLAATDFIASIDELINICPNLEQIALVVAWFGDDLRAGYCRVEPRVEVQHRTLRSGDNWQVAGLDRSHANLVSNIEGNPAYGGTPSDRSIFRAIEYIKSKGLKVCLNPFLLMDVPQDNVLPDPHSDGYQGAYPWRGRLTCFPGPSQPNSVDGGPNVNVQVANFIGSVSLGEISNGTSTEWSYRHMILHYANLAADAGGVDMFLVGSEMRGMTSLRGINDTFPFVSSLAELAEDIRPVLGPNCLLTYGADWSEYFGYQPSDGSGNVYFNMDELWSNSNIDAIGIDNYMPLSNWHPDNEVFSTGRATVDADMLEEQISAGEGFDWYYKSEGDRADGLRTSITDGLEKPWVFRYKDLVSWWSNDHFDRRAGTEFALPSNWVPQSKPIIFTEFGCPAIQNGAMQPNVFFDAKSAESALPYFSNGSRDDHAQVAYIAAHQKYWDDGHPEFTSVQNPPSNLYTGRMVDYSNCQLWAWDARPYPYFPGLADIWKDSSNWERGHWLNGRLGNVRLADLISELLSTSGIEECDVRQVYGSVDGYVIAESISGRQALDALLNLYQIDVFEDGGKIIFRSPGSDKALIIEEGQLEHSDQQPTLGTSNEQESELPVTVKVYHIDPELDFQDAESGASRTTKTGLRQQNLSLPVIVNQRRIRSIAQNWLRNRWNQRETVTFGLSRQYNDITAGDLISISGHHTGKLWKVSTVESGQGISIVAHSTEIGEISYSSETSFSGRLISQPSIGTPLIAMMDLPNLTNIDGLGGNSIAALTKPWSGELAVYSSPLNDGYIFRQNLQNNAFIGELVQELPASQVTSRWNYGDEIRVRLYHGSASSSEFVQVLNGANALAVSKGDGRWEIVQFSDAELISAGTWKLTGLLRGQAGTEYLTLLSSNIGAQIVMLNAAVSRLVHKESERGLELNWRIGPSGKPIASESFSQISFKLGYTALRTFSPVHLKVNVNSGVDINASWVRRDRINSDDWAPMEIPMNEESELYRVEIWNESDLVYSSNHDQPNLILSYESISEFQGQYLRFSVAQISAALGAGPNTETYFTLN